MVEYLFCNDSEKERLRKKNEAHISPDRVGGLTDSYKEMYTAKPTDDLNLFVATLAACRLCKCLRTLSASSYSQWLKSVYVKV